MLASTQSTFHTLKNQKGYINIKIKKRTVFMLSIHTASTGPSQMIHFLSSFVSFEHCLTIVLRIPSVHSCVFSSNEPYSWPIVMLFGLRITRRVVVKLPMPSHAVSASAKICGRRDGGQFG